MHINSKLDKKYTKQIYMIRSRLDLQSCGKQSIKNGLNYYFKLIYVNANDFFL